MLELAAVCAYFLCPAPRTPAAGFAGGACGPGWAPVELRFGTAEGRLTGLHTAGSV